MRPASVWGARRQAFTLVEIMIIVALIGLLATLAIPSYVKVRKQSQGKRIITDARQMDAAVDQLALEQNLSEGATYSFSDAETYLKTTWKTNDLLGNPFTFDDGGLTNQHVQISGTTKAALAGVTIDWGPY
jgi:type II secretory pathway pseudopilin PulG